MLAGLVLALLVVTAALAARWGRAGGVLLAGVSLVWLLVNRPMEGTTFWVVGRTHGLTAAALAGLAGLAIAALIVVRGD